MNRIRPNDAHVAILLALLFAVAIAPALAQEPRGSALRALDEAHPGLSSQIESGWREALTRMSAAQLDELRLGAGPDSIVLDGGETLAAFMAARRLVEMPLAVMVEPAGGGTSRGGALLLDAIVLPSGGGAPNGSLVGGTLRLDPLLPGGGGVSAAAPFQLTASVGQPTVARSNSAQTTELAGFWAPADAIAVDRIFRDGFE